MIRYREHPVPAALHGAVACGWTLEAGPQGVADWPVLPDTHMDLVADPAGRVLLAGPATVAQPADLPAGAVVVGLRLRPGAAQALLGVPANAVRDQSPDLADLWPGRLPWEAGVVAEATGPRGRLRALCTLLAVRLAEAAPPDLLVRHAVALVRTGTPTVAGLADATGLTSRQLLRRFDAAVGYGPKRLQRIVRLQRVLALHGAAPGTPLAQLAVAAGYADQAHLTRDWRALTGAAPGALLAARRVDVAAGATGRSGAGR